MTMDAACRCKAHMGYVLYRALVLSMPYYELFMAITVTIIFIRRVCARGKVISSVVVVVIIVVVIIVVVDLKIHKSEALGT